MPITVMQPQDDAMTASAFKLSRREFSLGGLAAVWTARFSFAEDTYHPSRVLLGTTGSVSKGIYSAAWNATTGELGPITLAAPLVAPTFLATRRDGARTLIYSVSEGGKSDSSVSALATVPGSSELRLINTVSSVGDGPTHLSLSPDGRSVFIANYGGGSISSYHVKDDGSLSEVVSHVQYEGAGPDHARQAQSHAHSAQVSPNGRFLLVNDLGLDRICIYRIDRKTAALKPNDPPVWQARPASGPRHIAFHPNGKWLYSVNELDSTVDVLRWDAAHGRLTAVDHVSTLKPGFPPDTAFAGEILISADGRYLYVGNRIGDETIAVFQVAADTGKLTLKQLASNGGKTTRHIAVDATGGWMVASNQDSNEIVVLRRDVATGELSAPVHRYPLNKPMFATWI
ncbi:lactonase family protein [Terriglobus tenax]|uniref:lactonase family protein n=1 Tax=Terriglobus tenax TaxID=1111115 RepID=UPI0021DF73D5|nr:lactonase family protein [Terriglobus tenax]